MLLLKNTKIMYLDQNYFYSESHLMLSQLMLPVINLPLLVLFTKGYIWIM